MWGEEGIPENIIYEGRTGQLKDKGGVVMKGSVDSLCEAEIGEGS